MRVGCDLMYIYFLHDEYTDVCDAADTQRLADIAIDALDNPDIERPKGEPVVAEMMRQ